MSSAGISRARYAVSALFVAALSVGAPALAQPGGGNGADARVDAMMARADALVALDADGCLVNDDPNEIVVCARPDPGALHRLPLPVVREAGERVFNPIPQGDASYVFQGSCHIDLNERNCFKGLVLVKTGFGGPATDTALQEDRLWQLMNDRAEAARAVGAVQVRALSTPPAVQPAASPEPETGSAR